MVRLKALELERFQSIYKPTRIELAPLTLMYGPNSAGKSAIYDALTLLHEFWCPRATEASAIEGMLNRWASKSVRENELAKFTSLVVEFELDPFSDDDEIFLKDTAFSSMDFASVFDEEIPSRIARLEMCLKLESDVESWVIGHALLAVGGRPFLRIGSDVSGTRRKREGKVESRYRKVTLWRNDLTDFAEGIEWVSAAKDLDKQGSGSGATRQAAHMRASFESVLLLQETTFRIGEKNREHELGVLEAAFAFIKILGEQLGRLLTESPPVVSASRQVPNPREAATVVRPFDPARTRVDRAIMDEETVISPADTDPHFLDLAKIAHSHMIFRVADDEFWESVEATGDDVRIKEGNDRFSKVNRYLCDYLFREKRYQLSCKSTLLVPIDLEFQNPSNEYLLSQNAYVSLHLIDRELREAQLRDVGSGVPFVLPVLSAVTRRGLIRIEQPELHLHPALQADIADVFVDCMSEAKAWQGIVETHSEHLLLRLIRRVREGIKKPGPKSVRLRADDVAIYYFDPQADGGTVVSRQVMTPSGDFYQEWPRGFFTDREKELFDE